MDIGYTNDGFKMLIFHSLSVIMNPKLYLFRTICSARAALFAGRKSCRLVLVLIASAILCQKFAPLLFLIDVLPKDWEWVFFMVLLS